MTQNRPKTTHLKGKQAKGIQALLTCDTIDAAAKQAGVTRKTLYRWLKDAFFIQEFNQAKRQLVQYSILKLQKATNDAVKTLTSICKDTKASPAARVSAAREILSSVLKSLDFEEFEDRLKELEIKK